MCCKGAATLVPGLLSFPLLLTYQFAAAALLDQVAANRSGTAQNTARSLILAKRTSSSRQRLRASRLSLRKWNSTSIKRTNLGRYSGLSRRKRAVRKVVNFGCPSTGSSKTSFLTSSRLILAWGSDAKSSSAARGFSQVTNQSV